MDGQMDFKINSLHILVAAALLMIAYVAVSNVTQPSAGSATGGGSGAQTVQVGDTVQVLYVGTLTNGTVFDSSALHNNVPLSFTAGSGQMIEGFDQGVIGMRLNETKNVTIPPNNAYGPVDPALFVQVPISQFQNQTVQVGMHVQSVSSSGQRAQGTVTAINATTVTVDFNPPLAGQTLNFKITVVSIQKKA